MPPKVKISKDDIIRASLELVREDGMDALNARSLATSLECSTQPIFSNFATMDALLSEVIKSAYGLYFSYLENEAQSGKYPTYKSFGMAYIRFAKEERNLFHLLFMRDRNGESLTPTDDVERSVEIIMSANGISRKRAELMHLEMWACVHGIATMIATSFFELDWELISEMLSDVYHGIRVRHIEEEKNERNESN